jgi:hypothetical protein
VKRVLGMQPQCGWPKGLVRGSPQLAGNAFGESRANFVGLESGRIPNVLSMKEGVGIDSPFGGASDAKALFH